MDVVIALGVGLTAGILGGMLGIGGGIVFVPGMVLLLGIEQHMAQGVSLAAIVVAATAGAITHYRQGTVNLDIAVRIAPTAIVFAFLGAWLATRVDPEWLRRTFSLLPLIIGAKMALGK